MPSFDTNTRLEKFMPPSHCVIGDTLSQIMPDRQTLLLFIDIMNLMHVEMK